MAAVTREQALLLELAEAMMAALVRGRQLGLMAYPGGYIVLDLGETRVH